jgi:hypothetical protein
MISTELLQNKNIYLSTCNNLFTLEIPNMIKNDKIDFIIIWLNKVYFITCGYIVRLLRQQYEKPIILNHNNFYTTKKILL